MNAWIRTGLLTGAMLWGAHAAQAQVAATGVPQKGFFVGAGGSVNFSTFPNQDVFAQGLSQIYSGDTLVVRGEAGGSTSPYLSGQTDFAPMAQIGYYERFAGSNWLWGAKFTYNYVNASSTQDNFLIPQAGYYTGEESGVLNGNVYTRGWTVKATNQFALVPFLGYAFDKSFVYFGGGPTLTEIKQELNGLVGFANLFGQHLDLTGAPVSYNSTNWCWGGTVSTGVTYFFAPDWFVDLNYTYTMSTTTTNRFAGPFDTSHDGLTFTGLALGTYSGTVDVQAVMVSINKLF